MCELMNASINSVLKETVIQQNNNYNFAYSDNVILYVKLNEFSRGIIGITVGINRFTKTRKIKTMYNMMNFVAWSVIICG